MCIRDSVRTVTFNKPPPYPATARQEDETVRSWGLTLEATKHGLRVVEIKPHGQAAQLGIQVGQELLRINGSKVRTPGGALHRLKMARGPIVVKLSKPVADDNINH